MSAESILSDIKTPAQMLEQLKAAYIEAAKLEASLEGKFRLLETNSEKAELIGQMRDCCRAAENIGKRLTPVFKRVSDSLCRDLIEKIQEGDVSGMEVKSPSYSVKPDLEMGFQIPTLKNDPVGFRQMHELLGTPLHYIDSGEVLT